MKKEDLRIVFMGTPDFAVSTLQLLSREDYNVVAVITAPDRPAGRGKKITFSPVKQYALAHNLTLFQPPNLKDEVFLRELTELNAGLQIVVAFRMLPKSVWDMPQLGTINLHASLLPQYRGAAPINHALINGENETGLTTFFIDEKIDTGRIIRQTKMEIGEKETFGELHDRMKEAGALLVAQTVKLILAGKAKSVGQTQFIKPDDVLKPAPRIFKDDCRIDWTQPAEKIHNLIRGLSPVPGAFTFLLIGKDRLLVKIFKSAVESNADAKESGTLITGKEVPLKVAAGDGYVHIIELQVEGKKRMKTEDFLKGNKLSENAIFE